MIYLDHHSATLPCKAALEAREYQGSLEGKEGPIYELAGAHEKDQFVFTSSGAEAINQVFWSVFIEIARKTGKCHIIISHLEDAPTMRSAKRLEDLGCTVKVAPVNAQGQIDLAELAALINPRTALISVTMAHGLTGVIQPVDEIVQLAKEKQVLLHLDATYAVGKYRFAFDADYLTFSGDRIHSVAGSGALFAKPASPLIPLILGGASLRGGAFDVPSFMAFSAAAQQSLLYLDTMALEGVRLRDLLEAEVKGSPLYPHSPRLPNTTAIAFDKVHPEALLYFLQRKGVYATIGGTDAAHLSRIHESAISFSLSRMTSEEEVLRASVLINQALLQQQALAEDI